MYAFNALVHRFNLHVMSDGPRVSTADLVIRARAALHYLDVALTSGRMVVFKRKCGMQIQFPMVAARQEQWSSGEGVVPPTGGNW